VSHFEMCGDCLVEILRVRHDPVADTDAVVRWCPKCGAVVVDEDLDGRTKPGALATIRFPRAVLDAAREKENTNAQEKEKRDLEPTPRG